MHEPPHAVPVHTNVHIWVPPPEQLAELPLQVPAIRAVFESMHAAVAQAAWPERGAPLTLPQVPAAAPPVMPPQYSHDPLQAVLQQTPSAQLLETHCVPAVQVWPFFFLQVPDASQVLAPVQLSASSALFTAVQVPPVPLHD